MEGEGSHLCDKLHTTGLKATFTPVTGRDCEHEFEDKGDSGISGCPFRHTDTTLTPQDTIPLCVHKSEPISTAAAQLQDK